MATHHDVEMHFFKTCSDSKGFSVGVYGLSSLVCHLHTQLVGDQPGPLMLGCVSLGVKPYKIPIMMNAILLF